MARTKQTKRRGRTTQSLAARYGIRPLTASDNGQPARKRVRIDEEEDSSESSSEDSEEQSENECNGESDAERNSKSASEDTVR